MNGRYAQRFNQRYDRVGHVFQNRFGSYVIESEEHFERALGYVRANPVEAGLCRRIAEWPWAHGPFDSDSSEGLSLGPVPTLVRGPGTVPAPRSRAATLRRRGR